MGTGRRRRDRRAQNDEFDPPPSPPYIQRRGPSTYTPPFPQLGPPSPSVDSNSNFGRDHPFQQRRQHPQQYRPIQQWHPSNRQSRPFTPMPQNHHVFLQKSLRLKQNLVRAFTQALRQIEQWYPDESADGDLMDWQPEDEFVIPQPDNTVYNYGKGAVQRKEYGCARGKIREVRFGTYPSGRQRAASDVGVSGASGCSTAGSQWSGTPRRFPEPESVSPLSDDLGSNYGIA